MIERVLIVGLGSIGRRHLHLAREMLPEADIRVLRRTEADAVPPEATGCFPSLEQAIAFAPQIAVIASPASLHLNTALPLARAGAHLLVEKPLSASPDGVAELLEACRNRNLALLVGYNLRFSPSLRAFRERLHSGCIGPVLSVRCEVGQYLPSWRPDADYRQGVSARSELGGGVLLELSHELDYLSWIFGKVSWVKAELSRQSRLEIDVEDTAHLTLGFAPENNGSGLLATVNMDFIRHDVTRCCTAIGENGSLRWNGVTGAVEQHDAGGSGWQEVFRHQGERDETYLAEWQHLLDCVDGKAMPLVSGEEGLRSLLVVQAARLSAANDGKTAVAGN